MNKADKAKFYSVLEPCHDDPLLFHNIKEAALFGFPRSVNPGDTQPADLKLACINNLVHMNKIALLGHLLVEPRALKILRDIILTTDLAARKSHYSELRNLAHELREDSKNDFQPPFITDEAFLAMKQIDPSQGSFKDADELKSCVSRVVSIHESLLVLVDGLKCDDAFDRRQLCFTNFICGKGKPRNSEGRHRNVALYYCFLKWEDTSLKFLAPVIDSPRGKFSLIMPAKPSQTVVEPMEKKPRMECEDANCDDRLALSSDGRDMADDKGLLTYDSSEISLNDRTPLPIQIQSKNIDKFYEEKAKTEESARLLRVMESPVFHTFSKCEQERIRIDLKRKLGLVGVDDEVAIL